MFRSMGSAYRRPNEDVFRPRIDSPDEAARTMNDCLGALARRNGMEFFMASWFPRGDRLEFSANMIAGNWPKELMDGYAADGDYGTSRLIQSLKESILPYYGDQPIFGSEQADSYQRLGQMFRRHGLCHHLAFALHDAHLNHYVFVFSARKGGLTEERIAALYFGCLELLDRCGTSLRHREGPKEKLSSRELECLRWSAAGKSSEEIAIILDISGHTVVSYLKSAMRKLDAVNRMQAIARAYRFRLL